MLILKDIRMFLIHNYTLSAVVLVVQNKWGDGNGSI